MLVAIFVVVLLVTLGLIVLLKIKTSISNSDDSDLFKKNLSQVVSSGKALLDIGVEKTIDSETHLAYYFLKVVLADDITIDSDTGDATGRFYFINDKAKNLINFRIKNNLDYFNIGFFNSSFDQDSVWNMDTAQKLVSLGKSGTKVELRGKFDAFSNPAEIDFIKEADSLFSKIQEAKGSEIEIPERFLFKAFSIGFVK